MAESKEQRLRKIQEMIRETGAVQVNELTELFDVTDMTVRRDLDELADRGVLSRVYGGAVAVSSEEGLPSVKKETSYTIRIEENETGKLELAGKVSALIQPGKAVFLDSGSTTYAIAQMVPAQNSCTYITNGINVAMMLLSRGCSRVIVIGGEVDLNTWSTRGGLAVEQLRKLHFDAAFLACNAVSSSGSVMIGNDAETAIKQTVMSNSRENYLAADSSKFGGYSLVEYARLSDFDGIITDSVLSPEEVQRLNKCGGRFLTAEQE